MAKEGGRTKRTWISEEPKGPKEKLMVPGSIRLPAPPQQVTVVAVGPGTELQPIGHVKPSLDSVHFIQVGRNLVLAGTIEDLRAFVGDLGMTVANIERDILTDLVEEGRERSTTTRHERQLA